ncbi:GNAT family N-acetyltransferase [Microtetraspora malaysiensis]|uniref:GNAT family N-acetyltransferase n=1 Tax=Microtetraspora malaysiensis TaxID=161358 RepID=UPI003D949D25
MGIRSFIFAERPDLHQQANKIFSADWPEFIFHDPVADQYMGRVREFFEDMSLLLVDGDDQIVAGGWGVPVRWDGTADKLPGGYDDALRQAVELHENGGRPDTLVIAAAQVRRDLQGQGLAAQMLRRLADAGEQAGLTRVIAPVRPTLKARYPLTPMGRFMTWTRPDGAPLDPWLRTHQRMGAHMLCPAERSMVMTGSVADWENWVGMAFPDSGSYVVPGALALVVIDQVHDLGELIEPNVWVQHR